jgi:hypothetical protein
MGTKRPTKTGNTYKVEKKGENCYDIDFYNRNGFLVARNPCLSKKDMEWDVDNFKRAGYTDYHEKYGNLSKTTQKKERN